MTYPRIGAYQSTGYSPTTSYDNRSLYGVVPATAAPSYATNPLYFGEAINSSRPYHGVSQPTRPALGTGILSFGEAINSTRPAYGLTAPTAPNVGGAAVTFGEATNASPYRFGITPPVLPPPRPQVNVAPHVPHIPVPQYNVPDRPIHFPTLLPTVDLPLPQRQDYPLTYGANTFPIPSQQGVNFIPPEIINPHYPLTYGANTFPIPSQQGVNFTPPEIINPQYPLTYAPNTYPIPSQQFSNPQGLAAPRSASLSALDSATLIQDALTLGALTEQDNQQQALLAAQRQAMSPPPANVAPVYTPAPVQTAYVMNPTQSTQVNTTPANTNAVPTTGSVNLSQLPKKAQDGWKKYGAIITAAAQKYNVPVSLLAGLILQESGFDPNAGSGAGAVGLGQHMPGTAKELGIKNRRDPVQSANGAALYLEKMLKLQNGNVTLALAAYNAGPARVKGAVPKIKETQDYVQIVQKNQQMFQAAGIA
ncbi:MAG: lytic transglycosylase domain-containing protein [Vampirovibrio sp.]